MSSSSSSKSLYDEEVDSECALPVYTDVSQMLQKHMQRHTGAVELSSVSSGVS